MNSILALRLATENLASKLVHCIPVCDQPRRDLLDWYIAERFLETHPEYHPATGSVWAGRFSSSDFEKTYGDDIWNNALPACAKWAGCAFASELHQESLVDDCIRHFCVTRVAHYLYEYVVPSEEGDRAMFDWENARRSVKGWDGMGVGIVKRLTKIIQLYDYKAFESAFREKIRVWMYAPLVTPYLPRGYSFLRTCGAPDCMFGCTHPNASLVPQPT